MTASIVVTCIACGDPATSINFWGDGQLEKHRDPKCVRHKTGYRYGSGWSRDTYARFAPYDYDLPIIVPGVDIAADDCITLMCQAICPT